MKVRKQKDNLLFSISHWEQSEELLAEFSGWKRFHKEMVCSPLLEAFNDQLKHLCAVSLSLTWSRAMDDIAFLGLLCMNHVACGISWADYLVVLLNCLCRFSNLSCNFIELDFKMKNHPGFCSKYQISLTQRRKTVQILHYLNFDFWLRCLSRWDQSYLSMLQGE